METVKLIGLLAAGIFCVYMTAKGTSFEVKLRKLLVNLAIASLLVLAAFGLAYIAWRM